MEKIIFWAYPGGGVSVTATVIIYIALIYSLFVRFKYKSLFITLFNTIKNLIIMTALKLISEIENYKKNPNVFTLNTLMNKVSNAKLCQKSKNIWNDFLKSL